MKYSSHKAVTTHKNSDSCVVYEHDQLGDDDFDCAVSVTTGRYPQTGRVVNTQVKEFAYVTKGTGRLVMQNQTIELVAGDCVVIEAGEPYYWDGNLTMVLMCKPKWYPEQHQLLEHDV